MPLHMRLPKLRGFKNPFRVEYQVVNLDKLAALYPEGGDVTVADLVAKGAVRDNSPVKVLGTGEITVKVNVTADKFSAPPRRRSRPLAARSPPPDRTRRPGYAAGSPLGELAASGPVLPSRQLDPAARGNLRTDCLTVIAARPHRPASPGGPVLTAFARAFRTPDLRRKLLFTLAIIVIFRLGSHVPVPGVTTPPCRPASRAPTRPTGVLGLANLFSGGALLQLSIFALGIMPYITASIIVQLLTVVIPRFEALKKEGQAGPDEDDAVHALPDDRPGGPAVHDADHVRPEPVGAVRHPSCTSILTDDVDRRPCSSWCSP